MGEIIRKFSVFLWGGKVCGRKIMYKCRKKNEKIMLFDPSLDSRNMGDAIIAYYCNIALKDILDINTAFRVGTHVLPEKDTLKKILNYRVKIVCGTNLITPHFEKYSIWAMPRTLYGYDNIITMGVGWEYYDENISRTSKFIYKTILAPKGLHSVRDSYTERMFHSMGVHNVINTTCPTLWGLTAEHCKKIKHTKSDRVIATITDYSRNPELDAKMLSILKAFYHSVYIWPQGANDFAYLQEICDVNSVTIIDRKLKSFTEVLDEGNIDYIGTRLHAGIHAINRGARSIIIAIDNRAIEMGRDVSLPMVLREKIESELPQYILSDFETCLNIPWDNIMKWKSQFIRGEE